MVICDKEKTMHQFMFLDAIISASIFNYGNTHWRIQNSVKHVRWNDFRKRSILDVWQFSEYASETLQLMPSQGPLFQLRLSDR